MLCSKNHLKCNLILHIAKQITMEVYVLLFVILGLLVKLLDCMWKPKLDLPYPDRLPVIGHLLSFIKSPHIMLMTWAKTCGDIYCIQLLNKRFVIVNGYEAAYEVLVTKGMDFAGRTLTYRFDIISENASGIICQSMNAKWKKLRLFTHQNVRQYGEGLGRIEEIVQKSAAQLLKGIGRDLENVVIDPYDHIYLSVINNMTALIIGTQLTLEDPMFRKLIKMEELVTKNITFARGAELDAMPWLRFFGNKTYRDLNELKKQQSDVFKTIQMMYRSNGLSHEGLAFAFMHEMESNKRGLGSSLTDDIVKVSIFDVLLAGVTTSAASLYIFVLLMATHPHIQEKLYEEIITCLSTKEDQHQETLSLADRCHMPYTRACLLELMRYVSVSPVTMGHTALVETQISSHKIPKGTVVFVNLFAIHHSEKYWEKPWDFCPERFLDKYGQLLPGDHVNRKRLLAFGAGPRVCIGQSFALSRMFILVTSLVQAFEISPEDGQEIKHDPREFEMRASLNAPRAKVAFRKRP